MTQEPAPRIRWESFSTQKIDAMRSSGEPAIISADDCAGLELRLGQNRCTWSCRYSLRGQRKFIRIGTLDKIDVTTATDLARKIRTAAANGKNPATAVAWDSGQTLAQIITQWERRNVTKSAPVRAQTLRLHMEPLLAMPTETLTEDDFQDILIPLAREMPPTASKVRNILSTVYRWAFKTRRIKFDPTQQIDRIKPPARDQTPSLDQCRRTMQWAGTLKPQDKAFVLTTLLTGCRTGEARAMCPPHIDLTQHRWVQPGYLTKNGHSHVVPLTQPVLDALAPLINTQRPRTPILNRMTEDRKKHLMAEWNILLTGQPTQEGGFRWHDLRRSIVSILAEHGGNPDALDKLLNHTASSTSTGVKQIYQKATLIDARREEVERWTNLLMDENDVTKR